MHQETLIKLRILKISLEEIKNCANKSHGCIEDDIYYYHIFSFTQIFYSLKEHLKKLEKNKNAEYFFNKRKDISNLLKHYEISNGQRGDLNHVIHIHGHVDPSMWEFLPSAFSTYEYDNKNVCEICETYYDDLITFLKIEKLI